MRRTRSLRVQKELEEVLKWLMRGRKGIPQVAGPGMTFCYCPAGPGSHPDMSLEAHDHYRRRHIAYSMIADLQDVRQMTEVRSGVVCECGDPRCGM